MHWFCFCLSEQQKIDFARYALLHKYGGVFSAFDVALTEPLAELMGRAARVLPSSGKDFMASHQHTLDFSIIFRFFSFSIFVHPKFKVSLTRCCIIIFK